MLKKLFTILFSLLFTVVLFGQEKPVQKRAELRVDTPEMYNKTQNVQSSKTSEIVAKTSAEEDWVVVDQMSNAYGPASWNINPIAYDPTSGLVTILHRGNASDYAAGSGELYWNYTTDIDFEGWVRGASVQEGFLSDLMARYPSATIHNPSASTEMGDLWGAFAWPELQPSGDGFGYLGYGVTLGFEETVFANVDKEAPLKSSTVPVFSDGEYVYWFANNLDEDATVHFYRTADYTSVDYSEPYSPEDSAGAKLPYQYPLYGDANGGRIALGMISPFPELIGVGGWEIAVGYSDDQGDTWSDLEVIDWTQIDATANMEGLWDPTDDNVGNYAAAMVVDSDAKVHVFTGMVHSIDTVSNPLGTGALVEFIQTDEGWDAKIIRDDMDVDATAYDIVDPNDPENYLTPGIGQMYFSPKMAVSDDGQMIAVQYVHKNPNTRYADIYLQFRNMDGDWDEAPINLTETEIANENGAHLAPRLGYDETDGTYYAYSMFWYEDTKWPGDSLSNSLNVHNIYAAQIPIIPSSVSSDFEDKDYSYELSQNYPNPFNPTTTINFTIPEQNHVTLKVYDVLGREVATLVNEVTNAGTHKAVFNASNLASGVYVYKITAGKFSSSQKMMLLK